MVIDGNSENLSGLNELLRDCEIFLAWLGIATGVIMCNDDAGRGSDNSTAEYFSWMDEA